MIPLRDQCQGRWLSLLPSLGVDRRHLSGKHGPCPVCEGRDRFRFDDKDGRGTWICSKCGAGDGIALAMAVNGWDFKTAAERIEPLAGTAQRDGVSRERDQKSLRDSMNRLWSAGKPVAYGDTVSRYLDSRSLALDKYPSALRYVEKCRLEDKEYHPAMIAKVMGPDGQPSTIHRTFLTHDGRKLPIEMPRRLMPGKTAKGCAIRLAEAGPTLGIAEGIETAMSAAVIWGVPVWAAVSSGMLMEWLPPFGTKEVIVFGDNDKGFAGQAAAYALAHRLSVRGLEVRVEMPLDGGMDWNDVLRAEKAERSAA